MAVRMTIGIPESLHEALRERAKQSGMSIRALIVRAIEQVYSKASPVTGPLVKGRGKLGPKSPNLTFAIGRFRRG